MLKYLSITNEILQKLREELRVQELSQEEIELFQDKLKEKNQEIEDLVAENISLTK